MASNRLQFEPEQNFTGCLLIATPSWGDSEFQQTVCLIVHHSAKGAIGVILNRTLPFDAKLLWDFMGEKKTKHVSGKVHLGGSQSGPVVAMHQREDLAEYTSGEGVYFAAQADYLKRLLADPKCQWKIFLGQATWTAGSLDKQFSEGKWLPIEVSSKIVFADFDRMWPMAIRQAGNRLMQSLTGIENLPEDILLN